MPKIQNFDRLVILGNGYSAQLAGMALAPLLGDTTIIGPAADLATGPHDVSGQYAHSHIFLPRMERELRAIDTTILEDLAALGHSFVPGSYRLDVDAPMECRRLFATRWQFNAAIDTLFQQRVQSTKIADTVTSMQCTNAVVTLLTMASRKNIEISASTLVIDAMGSQSPLMTSLIKTCQNVINDAGNIAYITQFFRLRRSEVTPNLPDPLIDCPHNFGNANIMLYPGAEGWFSISISVSTQHKYLMKKLRDGPRFLEFCRQSTNVASWLDGADPIGPNRIYINPRNRWNVPIFTQETTPRNYLAVGDALTSMLPTLGANCSFAATHVRIVRDLLDTTEPRALHSYFAYAVHQEQFAFFQDAQSRPPDAEAFVPYSQARSNRRSKRLKRGLSRLLGLDRTRIARHLIGSSSL
jgi:hypothetical protein